MPQKRLLPQCLKCKFDLAYKAIPEGTDELIASNYLLKVMECLTDQNDEINDAYNTKRINALKKEYFNLEEDFSYQKKYYNDLLLKLEPKFTEAVFSSSDPLKTAIQYAVTGNYIDFGSSYPVSEEKLLELFADAQKREIDLTEYEYFKKDLSCAKTLLYCCDNCGEVILDKILIKAIQKYNPEIKITAVVRGYPVYNDVTLKEAKEVGLTDLVEVIDNGTDIVGTDDNYVNDKTKSLLKNSNVVLSKGVANMETLLFRGYNTYFIFMIKCSVFERQLKRPMHSSIFINDKRVPNEFEGWKS